MSEEGEAFFSIDDSQTTTRKELRYAAMDLLARREHSQLELQQKLSKRFEAAEEIIVDIVQALAEEGLQSDERLAEAFVRFRLDSGKGPMRIRAELQQKGIASHLIALSLEAIDEEHWVASAEDTLRRKFGDGDAQDAKERARRYRFLQYRGFSGGQIQRLL